MRYDSNDATNTPSYKFSTSSEDEDPFEYNSDLDPNFELIDNEKTITESEHENDLVDITTKKRKRFMKKKERNSRKRHRKPEEWADNKAKSMLDPCKCRFKCADKMTEENRQNIFEDLWGIADHTRQWDFILRFVEEKPKNKSLCAIKSQEDSYQEPIF
ncbi:unnamed protein product [Acanthoscelides obtectus]|uniref:Uncharacterized protein n=2 Tax=Acanthoscelides obtectus TaxID=200917 RepID=A0A9P0LXL7_ACAOB|nr:unnamed protein product [Acanthoscelides obtectus]CAK1652623.1 hypothetical protein AOBTE_LOCUS17870 [Acanthoscelides obtectus]